MTQNQIALRNARENERHNMAYEQEQNRHNIMSEKLEQYAQALQKWQIAVNNLHYTRQDAETERANRARETYNIASLDESARSNRANESIKSAANAIQSAIAQETSRHQKAVEAENLRHNVVGEVQNRYRNAYDAVETVYGAAYTKAQTSTEHARTGLTLAQTAQSKSQTTLNYELADTQTSVRFSNYASGVKSGSDAISGLLKVIVPTGGGATDAATQSRQIWKALDAQLKY